VPHPEFVVARKPDPESSLPYLIRLPLGPEGVVLKARHLAQVPPLRGRPTWTARRRI
jgi:hypothetical protein